MAAFPILGFYFPPQNEDRRLPVSESSEIFVEKKYIYSWARLKSTALDTLWAQNWAYLKSSIGDCYHTKDCW